MSVSGFSGQSPTTIYVPTVASGSLWSAEGVNIWSVQVDSFGVTFNLELMAVVTLVSLVGSIQMHGMIRAIFGPEGPAKNPKLRDVTFASFVGIGLGINPDDLPTFRTYQDLLQYVSNDLDNHRIAAKRMMIFSPVLFNWFISKFVLLTLLWLVFTTDAPFILVLIFLIMVAIEIREKLWAPIPSPAYTDDKKATPEFNREE